MYRPKGRGERGGAVARPHAELPRMTIAHYRKWLRAYLGRPGYSRQTALDHTGVNATADVAAEIRGKQTSGYRVLGVRHDRKRRRRRRRPQSVLSLAWCAPCLAPLASFDCWRRRADHP